MSPLLQFAGRLHPLVLHAPIGLAIGLAILEAWWLVSRRPPSREARTLLAWILALSAAAAVASGLILEEEGGYNALTVQLHKWIAIGVGVLAVVGAIAISLGRTRAYAGALLLVVAALVPAGHFGASMTHGPDFLFEPFRPVPEPVFVSNPVDATPGAGGSGSVYAGTVAPILQARCVSCHGADRDKGGLRLHTPDAILLGGDMGPALVPGDPAASDLVKRMRLPLEHDDHMPPKSKPQPTEAEIAALEAWIAAGAKFDDAPAQATVDRASGPELTRSDEPAPAAPDALAEIRARLVHAEPISRGSPLLLIDTAAVARSINDEALAELLEPVRGNIADLALARTNITDASMELLASLPRLRRLNLSGTRVTDAGLERLAGHESLEELVLTQTDVSDLSFDTLTSLPKLSALYVWKSRLTPETIAELRHELGEVAIDAGDTPDAAPLAEAAPAPAANPDAIAAAVAAALKPVNSACPVSAKPADPRFALVHNGRVIAFCCEHCLAQFVAEPTKFEVK